MNLYVFYLGGNARKSNIEVHDIQFVAASQPEEAWPALREAWFGDADKVHIDGYGKLSWADGHRITLCTHPPKNKTNRLWFVNAGAYDPASLAEVHAFDFFVTGGIREAKKRAMQRLLKGKLHQHKDNLKDVDDCLLLDKVGEFYIHLTPDETGVPFMPEWQGYQPISSMNTPQ
ncbi:DUF1543 domain-containing protein [Pantoea vagans]|uniref:DUF1543 domain-containing protein n=1 Tax=Pantoea vagans TaxID=470934 RepID=UPI000CE67466|nr:DUF1543 domain-containing protein [Pantoea vagans]AVE16795.1 DUF1543 domain-containing protein [Pantoea vagans]